ncbi:MAG: hypothetical protein HY203_02165 [Nitrospirae bacterium]|nr:hypothetical protein [Nitrospirota bacterium]
MISVGLLIFLALWPLSNETVTVVPPETPSVSPPLMTTESPPSTTPSPTPPKIEPAVSPAVTEKDRDTSKPIGPEKSSVSKKTTVKSKPETHRVTVTPTPPSKTIGQLDLEEIHSLLNRLKTAYSEKDILTIKQAIALLGDQEALLMKIFNSYKTVQSDIEAVKVMQNRVTSAILITSLENEKGNVVIPAPSWGRQSLQIAVSDNHVNQVTLDPDDFKSSQKGLVDLIAPDIIHSLPSYTAKPGEPTVVSATITDDVKVVLATLHFRAQGEQNYESIRMSDGPDHTFTAPIPGSMIKAESTSMEYYIGAKDAEGNLSLEGRPSAPLVIAVVPPPPE